MPNDTAKYPETVRELSELLKKRKISSEELTRYYIERVERLDADFNCFITKDVDFAIEQAQLADKILSSNDGVTVFTGIPLAIKDIFLTKGMRTTCASRMLENYIPPYDATVVQKVRQSGAVITGKLNMDEFAMGSSNEFSAFGPVKNPWNTQLSPGGSSGGSAAAIAARMTPVSLGTDTGGSVRLPASYCGITAIKPTYGRVSRYGVIAFASSLDQVGPMALSVWDCAAMLEMIAGYDKKDSTSINAPVPNYTSALNGDIKGMTIGVPKEYFVSALDNDVADAIENARRDIEALGANIVKVSLPHSRYAVPCYYIIAPAEASSNLARYDGVRFGLPQDDASSLEAAYENVRTKGFGDEVALRIIIGTYVLSSGYYDAYYAKAQRTRSLIKQDFANAFEKCDAILAPISPTPPFKLGEKTDDPMKMYLNDIYTIPVNLAGLCSLAVPCGFSKSKSPIGMQIIGNHMAEEVILRIGYAYEQATEWHRMKPREI